MINLKNIIESKIFRYTLVILGVIVIALLIFQLGMRVGFTKADFSYKWGENYHKNFAGPREGFFGDWRKMPLPPGDFLEAHGVFGSIIRIDGSTLVIKGSDNIEKTVLISDKTQIQDRRETLKVGDLKVDDQVVIIGSPTKDGQIEAKFIRIMPK
jgi:hypothetical protein